MKRIASIMLLSMLLFACSSCVHRYPDHSGADARKAMSQTVKVSVQLGGVMMYKDAAGKVVAKETTAGWTGSGVVVDVDRSVGKGESLILSAAHVTDVQPVMVGESPDGGPAIFIAEASLTIVTTFDGRTCSAEQIAVDRDHDVGVLKANCVAGEVAKVARSMPPLGAMVTVSGAGLGHHPTYSFLVTDGRFVGLTDSDEHDMIFTTPIAPGHSGSGVFYEGEVVSIVSKRYNRYEHGAFGSNLTFVQRTLTAARAMWRAQ